MRDFRSILNILGLLLCIESLAMIIPLIFDLFNNHNDWRQFFYSSIITFVIGIVLFYSFKKEKKTKIDIRQAFVLTLLSWILVALFGAIPFIYTESSLGYT